MKWLLMAITYPELISCRDVSKSYSTEAGPLTAVDHVSLSLSRNETLAVVGPSGCGKSTLLLMMAGLEKPSSGRIRFRGIPLFKQHRDIGLVLQDYGLFPWKTVRNNIELGLRIRGQEIDHESAHELMANLEILDKASAYPQQLSGGQKQRVALARALILEPALLLLDEPFAALDTLTRERLQDLLAAIWRKHGLGIIVVTHNIQEAVFLGRKIAVMGRDPSGILAVEDNTDACKPDFRGSEEFYSRCRIIRKRLEEFI